MVFGQAPVGRIMIKMVTSICMFAVMSNTANSIEPHRQEETTMLNLLKSIPCHFLHKEICCITIIRTAPSQKLPLRQESQMQEEKVFRLPGVILIMTAGRIFMWQMM